MFLKFFICCILCPIIWAKTHTFNWTTGWDYYDVDGMGKRPVITCNGEFPWPDIRVTKGDRIQVYLTNGFNNSDTSLHFHGIFQNGTNQMDGPPMVSSCPITPGNTMLYNFTVQDNVGTYWYHSHTEGQYEDGFRAMFIIDDGENNKNFPYEYDKEMVLSIGEWYGRTIDVITKEFLNLYNPTGAEPIPQNLIMNNTRNLTWNVEPDTTYLLKVGNFGGFVSQYFWIEDHDLEVVGVDGVYTSPNVTDKLYITVGQRYEILLRTKNDTSRNYAIMQKFDDTMLDVIPKELQLNSTHFLTYNSSAPQPEQNLVTDLDVLDDFYLNPLDTIEVYGDPDRVITLNMTMDNLNDGINYALFNEITYVAPKVPALLTALTSGDDALNETIYGSNTNTFVLQKDEIVEIVLNNQDTGTHPFHLHGHVFQVIARDREYVENEEDPTPYDPNNHPPFPQNPMRRDTIYVRPQSNFVIRFKADNPGAWFFHCHVEWHLIQGLAIVLIEDPLGIQESQSQQYTANHLEVCQRANVLTSGNAAGNTDDLFDLTGEKLQKPYVPKGFTAKGIVAMVFSCIAGTLGLITISIYGILDVDKEPKLDDISITGSNSSSASLKYDAKRTSQESEHLLHEETGHSTN